MSGNVRTWTQLVACSICLMLFYIMPVTISVHLLYQQPETKPSPWLSPGKCYKTGAHKTSKQRVLLLSAEILSLVQNKRHVTCLHTYPYKTNRNCVRGHCFVAIWVQTPKDKGMYMLSLPEAPAIVHLGDSSLKYKEQSMERQIQGICTQGEHQYIGQQQVTQPHH